MNAIRSRALALALLVVQRTAPQTTNDTSPKTFYAGRDAAVAAGFMAASAGLSVFDARIAHFFRDTSLTHVRVGHKLDSWVRIS